MARDKLKYDDFPANDIKYIKTPDGLRDIKGSYSLHKGIYVIDFEIYVPNGCGLILEPGIEFYFTRDVGITCEGRFEAKGKSGLEVLLTAKNKQDGWKNLYLKSGAEAILDYAGFSYGKGRVYQNELKKGGAVLLGCEDDMNPTISINNSKFEYNSADYGGTIYNYRGDIRIKKDNIFENNSAESGGGINNCIGNIEINKNNIFKHNFAKETGGAIYISYGDIRINKNNTFENNSAVHNGGAIRNYNGKLDIDLSKNIFKNNTPDDIHEV